MPTRGLPKAKLTRIKALVTKHTTPFYIFDGEGLQNSIDDFSSAFSKHLPKAKIYYAVKSNPHPLVIKQVLKNGFGLDVSSGRELMIGIENGAKDMLFTGPGKTNDELALAVKYNKIVTINFDSFGCLKRLAAIAAKNKKTVRAGVRFFTKTHGKWNKFGIPLSELKKFVTEAKKYPGIRLEGLHSHSSHNKTPENYQEIIKEFADYLKENFTPEMLKQIKYIDLGGGFVASETQGIYLDKEYSSYELTKAASCQAFAKAIGSAIKKHLSPLVSCAYYFEPGRIISTKSMHILTRVTDIKSTDKIILDGGINMQGWEWAENFYMPMFNLTHPSSKEIKALLFGPLCTPHDIMGYFCYASRMDEDDLILLPNQGAYKYSMAQNFIKPIPDVHILR